MNKRSRAAFVGNIRLVPNIDGIGIPVFAVPDSNMLFVPETDAELRIVRFLDFFNEEGYFIDYNLPRESYRKWYRLGDPGPLPFWIEGTCHVLEGNASRDAAVAVVSESAANSPVVADVARILGNARDGVYKNRAAKWKAREIAESFGDVLYEPPVHSAYWVSRYRIAVATARELTQPPHPIDRKLRSKAKEWLARFGSKADVLKLQSLLGHSDEGIFNESEIRSFLFAYFTHKFATGSIAQIQKEAQNSKFFEYFPKGLYWHYIEYGWPKVNFPYSKPNPDFLSRLREEIYEANRTEDFRIARRLAMLLFGQNTVPDDISNLVGEFLRPRVYKFDHELTWAFNKFFRERSNAREWPKVANMLLRQHTQLVELDSIEHADSRFKPIFVEKRFGISFDLYNQVRQYAGLHPIKKRENWQPVYF